MRLRGALPSNHARKLPRGVCRTADQDHDERRQSGGGASASIIAQRRRRAGAQGVHHHAITSRSIPWHCSTSTRSTIPQCRRDRRLTAGYADKTAVLRRQAGPGRRDDRGGVLSQGRDRPPERFQDERIRQPARWPRITSRPRKTRCSASAAPRVTTIPRYRDGFALECRGDEDESAKRWV